MEGAILICIVWDNNVYKGILWDLFMRKKYSVAELRMSLKGDHKGNYLRYLRGNRADVMVYCKTLCGMSDVEARRAYDTLLNDEVEDSSGKSRSAPRIKRNGRRTLTRYVSGDAIRF